MARSTQLRFSIAGQPLFPHIKLTRERFPRALATRLIESDGAEYFGAFLNRSNARLLMDFVIRTFRLRGCEFDLDGSFDVPCTQYFRRRCLAPCVESLCSDAEYRDMVGLTRSFLANERELLGSLVSTKIEAAAQELDFERAVRFRDILTAVEAYWSDTRRAVWLDNTTDTIEAVESSFGLDVFLVSQKGRRVLGERTFTFAGAAIANAGDAIAAVIRQFYRFHAPAQIRISHGLAERDLLSKFLADRFERRINISSVTGKTRRVTADVAVYRSSAELDLRRNNRPAKPTEVLRELKAKFRLKRIPKLITAVDAASISGTGQVVASVSWREGRSVPELANYTYAEGNSDAEAIGRHVGSELTDISDQHLVLIDGGLAQLNAAIGRSADSGLIFVSAVKPPGRHDKISHFLSSDGSRIEFDSTSPAMLLLHRLRDEAHSLANAVHRDTRDFAAFYITAEMLPSISEAERRALVAHFGSNVKLAAADLADIANLISSEKAIAAVNDLRVFNAGQAIPVRPLVVQLRYQAENGAADDLRPIEFTGSRSHTRT